MIVKKNDGFTIVEIIVALALTMIIINLGFLLLRYAHKQIHFWKQRDKLVRSAHILDERFYRDVSQARSIVSITEKQIALMDMSRKAIVYNTIEGKVSRNQIPILSENAWISDFKFEAVFDLDEQELSGLFTFEPSEINNSDNPIKGICYTGLLIDSTGYQIEIKGCASLRNHKIE